MYIYISETNLGKIYLKPGIDIYLKPGIYIFEPGIHIYIRNSEYIYLLTLKVTILKQRDLKWIFLNTYFKKLKF